MATPNLSDILGYYGEDGEASMLDYLTDLYFKSLGGAEGSDDWGAGNIDTQKDFMDLINSAISESGTSFSQMSAQDIEDIFKYHSWEQRTRQGSPFRQLEEDEYKKLSGMAQALQEGFKAAPSPESFGYGQKIGDIETGTRRDIKSAYEGYIPGETLSRYGALQGKPGMQQAGEAEEVSYLSDIYGIKRGAGRDIRGTQKEYKEDWFSGIENWLSNVSS